MQFRSFILEASDLFWQSLQKPNLRPSRDTIGDYVVIFIYIESNFLNVA